MEVIYIEILVQTFSLAFCNVNILEGKSCGLKRILFGTKKGYFFPQYMYIYVLYIFCKIYIRWGQQTATEFHRQIKVLHFCGVANYM